jgi:hypothetical protein
MTRINCWIPPAELCDAHLRAEHREITRIPNTIKSGRAKIENIPKHFRLGTGHVTFFYDKIGYIRDRYKKLYRECRLRGFDVSDKHDSFIEIPNHLMKTWSPYEHGINTICQRINERLAIMKDKRHTH